MLKKTVAILIGGFIGGSLRQFLELVLHSSQFPVATLVINLTGAFALCFINARLAQRWPVSPAVAVGLTTGLVGSYTTYSTLVLEHNELWLHGQGVIAIIYLIVSFIGGLITAKLGMVLGGRTHA